MVDHGCDDPHQPPDEREAAATELFGRYCTRLRGLVHRQMGWSLRQVEESSDVMQSAFHSFFRYMNHQAPAAPPDDVWPLLATITLNKIRNRARFWRRRRRDPHRQTRLEDLVPLLDRNESPDEIAAVKEILDQVLQSLSPRRQRILELVLQGYGFDEIAAQLGTTARTVYNTRLAAIRMLDVLLKSESP